MNDTANTGAPAAPRRKPRPTTFKDISGPNCEMKAYTVLGQTMRMGRSSVTIRCPFCEDTLTAYIWSISGGGKRCDCGALLGGRGHAYKLKEGN